MSAQPSDEPNHARVLVVLPTYNERDNLENVVKGIRAKGFDIVVVDDASPDGTGELADQMAAKDPSIKVLHRPHKSGIGSAKIDAFTYALGHDYEAMMEMDADASHLPEFLGQLTDAVKRNGGVSIGSRYIPGGSVVGWGPARRALSFAANTFCRTLLGLKLHDCTSGFRCYSADTLRRVGLNTIVAEGYGYHVEMLYRCYQLGAPITEVPIRFVDRMLGESKVSISEIMRSVLTVLRLRFGGNPYRRRG